MPAKKKPAPDVIAPRAKGRPRVTSQEKIIEAGLALAASDPFTTVSVVAIARKLEIAPMAIYNYFPSRDALMQALSAHLLNELDIRIPAEATASQALEIWARRIRTHFLRYPELLWILGYENGYASGAWLTASKELFKAMEKLGFANEDLVRAIRWFWNVIMSAITVEVQESLAPVAIPDEIVGQLEKDVAKVAKQMRKASTQSGFSDGLFEFHLDMALRALTNGNTKELT